MDRRSFLSVVAASGLAGGAGCLGSDSRSDADTDFELVEPELAVEDPPEVSVDGDAVTVLGTVEYGSGNCGTVELAHAEYERSQAKLDVLVVAGDESENPETCNEDLRWTGYRVEATVDGRLDQVAVTEHHAFGETYSTTEDLSE